MHDRARSPLAYTTVQTMLNILTRRKNETAARVAGTRLRLQGAGNGRQRRWGQGSVRDLIDRMFGGSSEELVMSLLQSRQLDAKWLAELTERFNSEDGSGEGGGA